MKNADVGFYLLHIAEGCEKILRYMRDMKQSDFAENQMVQDAVLRNFEIVGEAAKHVPTISAIGIPTSNGGAWRASGIF